MKLADPALLKNQCLVDGKWVGEGTDEVRNPATGAHIAKVPRFGFDETVRAIEAAEQSLRPVGENAAEGASGNLCAAGSISSSRTAKTSRSS